MKKFDLNISDIVYLLILAILVMTVFFSVPLDADFGWYEAGRHAMDGIFYLDIFRECGIFSPIQYAYDYYQHYPAITPVMYPPFFGVVQSVAFFLIGLHPWVSRFMVALFLGWGAWGLIRYSKNLLGEDGGFYSGLIYISLPIVIYWSREVMLEIPTMVLIIWSFYYFYKYLEEDKTKDMALCLIFATLSPYTKQNAVFVFPAFFVAAILAGKIRQILSFRFMTGLFVSFLCGIPLMIVTFKWGMLNINQSFGNLKEALPATEHALYYFKMLPQSLGWHFMIMAIAGIVVLCMNTKHIIRNFRTEYAVLAGWGIIVYIQMASIKIKEPRHGFFWMPIFAILAAWGIQKSVSFISDRNWSKIFGSIIILIIFVFNLIICEMNWSEGFFSPAQYLKNNWKGSAVLVNIYRDAPFIFHLRTLDSDKKMRVYRVEKIFESMSVYKEWGVKALIHNDSELLESLQRYGVRYLLIQDPTPNMTLVEKLIRKVVKNGQFKKIETFSIVYPDYQPAMLSLYRYEGSVDEPGVIPQIHIPNIGKVITSD